MQGDVLYFSHLLHLKRKRLSKSCRLPLRTKYTGLQKSLGLNISDSKSCNKELSHAKHQIIPRWTGFHKYKSLKILYPRIGNCRSIPPFPTNTNVVYTMLTNINEMLVNVLLRMNLCY